MPAAPAPGCGPASCPPGRTRTRSDPSRTTTGVIFAASPAQEPAEISGESSRSARFRTGTSYTGGTILNGGTLSLGNSSALGTGSLTILGSTVDYADTVNITNAIVLENNATLNVNTGTATQTGAISQSDGVYGITKTGAGTLTLGGTNTYSGGTTISDGVLTVFADSNLGAANSPVTFQGGTLSFGASTDISAREFITTAGTGDARVSASSPAPVNLLTGPGITGTGGLIKTGSGPLNLQTDNTYSGATQILAGALDISGSNDERLPDGTAVSINSGATLRLYNGVTETIGSLSGNGNVHFEFATGSHLRVGADNSSTTFGGRFLALSGGDGRLTKIGTGTLTLTGDNTYSGDTTIKAGTLAISADNNIAAASNIVLDGGLLGIAGTGLADDSAITNSISFTSNGGGFDIIDPNHEFTYAAALTHTGPVVKRGPGRLTLTNDNTYTGDTTIAEGVLRVGNGGTSGAILGDVTNNASLIFNRSDDVTFGGAISGTGSLTKEAANTLSLTGTNTYTGGTTINGGTVALLHSNAAGVGGDIDVFGSTISYGSSVTINNPIVLHNNATLDIFSGSAAQSGNISQSGGTFGITKTGNGRLELLGTNNYGQTTIQGGTLAILSSSALGSGGVTIDGGFLGFLTSGVNSDGDIPGGVSFTSNGGGFDVLSSLHTYTHNAALTHAGPLTKRGAGTLTLNGANTHSGGTTLEAGTLKLGTSSALGTGGLTVKAGTVDYVNAVNITNAIELQNNATFNTSGGAATQSGAISESGGSFGITKLGMGNLTLSSESTFSGTTNIAAGKLILANGFALQNSTVLLNANDGLDITTNGVNTTLGALAGSGNLFIDLLPLRVGNNGDDTTYSGNLTATPGMFAGGVTKQGSGVMTLTGDNSGLRQIRVEEGTVVLDGGTSSADVIRAQSDGEIIVENSGSLTAIASLSIGGTSFGATHGGRLTVRSGATVNSASALLGNENTPPSEVLVTGTGSFWETGSLTFGNHPGTANLLVTADGAVQVNGQTLFDTAGNSLIVDGGTFSTGTLAITGGLMQTIQISDPDDDEDLVAGSALVVPGGPYALTIGTNDGSSTINAPINDAIGGPGTLVKVGAGTLTLGGTNTYSGGTILNGGTLSLGHNNALGTGNLTIQGSTVDYAHTINIANAIVLENDATLNVNTGSATQSGAISESGGSFGITKTGAGRLALTGANSYSGGTNVNGGALAADTNLGAATGPLSFDGGALLYDASFDPAGTRAITLNAGGGTFDTNGFDSTLAQSVTGTGRLFKAGAGTLALTGTNSYSGGTFLIRGTLAARADSNLGAATGSLLFDGGTLRYDASFDMNVNRPINILSDDGKIDTNGFNSTIAGSVTGSAGRLTKAGTGTLTLTGNTSGLTSLRVTGGGVTVNGGQITTGDIDLVPNDADITFLITGAGSTVMTDGIFTSAPNTGTTTTDITVADSATVTTSARSYIEGNGDTLTVDGGTFAGGGLAVTPDNEVIVENSGALNVTGSLRFGEASSSDTHGGRLTVRSGGTVNSGTAELGDETSSGVLSDALVTGAGSFWETRNLILGEDGGAANLLVTADGAVQVNSQTLFGTAGNSLIVDGRTFSTGTLSITGGPMQTIQITDPVVMPPIVALTIGTDNGDSTIDIPIADAAGGPGTLEKVGTGTLTLNNLSSTYSGGTIISGGALFIAGDGALGDASGNVHLNGGELRAGGATNRDFLIDGGTIRAFGSPYTINGTLSGAGALRVEGIVTLNADNSGYSGDIDLANTLKLGDSNAAGSGKITANGVVTVVYTEDGIDVPNEIELETNSPFTRRLTLTVGHGLNVTQSGPLTQLGDTRGAELIVDGSGTLELTNTSNNFQGEGRVIATTLSIPSDAALGHPSARLRVEDGGTLRVTGTTTSNRDIGVGDDGTNIDVPDAAHTYTINGLMDGDMDGTTILTKIGLGTLKLTANNTYPDGTRINGGTLALSSDTNIGLAAAPLSFDGGTLRYDAAFNLGASRAITLEAGGGTFNTNGNIANVFSVIGGSGALTKTGAGTLIPTATNNYSGGTSIDQGTLGILFAASLGSGPVTMNGGLLGLVDTSIGNDAAIPNTISFTTNGGGFDVFNANHTFTYNTALTHAGPFMKRGPGQLVLTNANTYTGDTTISEGTLLANNTTGSATGSGAVIANSGATFGGTGSVGGAVTVNAGGTVAPGISPGILTVGSVTLNSGSQFAVELAGSGGIAGIDFDQLIVNGLVDLIGDPTLSVRSVGNFLPTIGDEFEIMTWQTGLNGMFDLSVDPFIGTNDIGFQAIITNPGGAGDLTLRAVPEPAGLMLVMAGALFVARRRGSGHSMSACSHRRSGRTPRRL